MSSIGSAATTTERSDDDKNEPYNRGIFIINGDNAYELNLYLVRQMLVFCRIRLKDAQRIVHTLESHFQSKGQYRVSQSSYEEQLYSIIQNELNSASALYLPYLKVATEFITSQGTLVVFITGTPCIGGHFCALRLARRLNVPNVVRTQTVANILTTNPDAPIPTVPEGETESGVLTRYKEISALVRMGLRGDIDKAMKNRKSVVVEGIYIDPPLYREFKDSGEARNGSPVFVFLLLKEPCTAAAAAEGLSVRTISSYLEQHETSLFDEVIEITDHVTSDKTIDDMHKVVLNKVARRLVPTGKQRTL